MKSKLVILVSLLMLALLIVVPVVNALETNDVLILPLGPIGYAIFKFTQPAQSSEEIYSTQPSKGLLWFLPDKTQPAKEIYVKKPVCTDSDGGKNYYLKGTTNGSNGQFTDYCGKYSYNDSFTLNEYWCNDSIATVIKYYCSDGCINGTCLSKVALHTLSAQEVLTDDDVSEYPSGIIPRSPETIGCSDSDWGKNYFYKGICIDESGKYIDICIDSTHLREYNCIPNSEDPTKAMQCKSITYTCSLGCKNDACIKATPICTDSDGGKILTKKGSVTNIDSKNFTDFCIDNTLYEHYCDISKLKYGRSYNQISYNCKSEGYIDCKDGTCRACVDSDNGANFYVKGTTTGSNGQFVDSCNGKYVSENFCSGANVIGATFECPNGCKNGACIGSAISVTITPSSKCTDTDGGKKFYTKGTCTYRGPGMTDYCLSDGITLREWYCEYLGTVKSCVRINYKCPIKCTRGACTTLSSLKDIRNAIREWLI